MILLAVILLVAGSPAFAQSTPLALRIQQCAGCHGDDGNSRLQNIPSLAGQPEFFVLNQLFLMREGVRKVEAMTRLVKDMDDSEIAALAKQFAGMEPKPSNETVDPNLAQRGSELSVKLRCASCHLPNMTGQQQMPRLALQRVDYLIRSMKDLRDNKRSGANTLMSNVVVGLSDDDLAALAHYATSR